MNKVRHTEVFSYTNAHDCVRRHLSTPRRRNFDPVTAAAEIPRYLSDHAWRDRKRVTDPNRPNLQYGIGQGRKLRQGA